MSDRHRILLMGYRLDHGGSERQLAELAKGLDRARFEPHVACLRAGGVRARELLEAGIPVTEFRVRSFYRPSTLGVMRQMGRYLRENGIDLVHTFDPPTTIFGIPTAKLFGVRRAVSSQRAYRSLTQGVYNILLRATDRIADCIVVNGQMLRRHMIEDERVAPGKLFLCPNSLDTDKFRPRPEVERPEALKGRIVIGCIALLRPEKDHATLVSAFAKLQESRPDTRLLIVGSGPTEAALRAQAGSLGISEACWFEPATDHVAEWLNRLDIFVLPSRSEAFSNSLMEAMAAARCVIASNVGGNGELVQDFETGLLFRAGDAADLYSKLRAVVEDERLRCRLAGEAMRRVRENFSTRRSVERMESLYAHLLEGRPL